jgi:hypothetical protein
MRPPVARCQAQMPGLLGVLGRYCGWEAADVQQVWQALCRSRWTQTQAWRATLVLYEDRPAWAHTALGVDAYLRQDLRPALVLKALARERTAPPALDAAPRAPAPEAPGLPAHEIAHDDNTVIQAKAPRGSSPPGQYKLTSRQVASLRAKRQRGTPIKALMEEYGLSKASVFRYLH